MDDFTAPPAPRRRKLTAAELYFPPHIVRAVKAEEACGAKPGQPVTLAGGCVLHRLAPISRPKPVGRGGNDAA